PMCVDDLLSKRLPARCGGHPVRFPRHTLEERHHVELHTPATLWEWVLGFDPNRGVELTDWLSTPSALLGAVVDGVVDGAVFKDSLGILKPGQTTLAWYPDDVWRYVLACQWRRIAQ